MRDSFEHIARRNTRRVKESARVAALTPDSDIVVATRRAAINTARQIALDSNKYDARTARCILLSQIARGV
jgi:hypothetical protein